MPLLLTALAACQPDADGPDGAASDETMQRAQDLAREAIIVDGHIDVPYRMVEYAEDISRATEFGDFDYPRARAGGLDAPFMSIYIPADRQETPGSAKTLADSLIDMVEGFIEQAPQKFARATSVADVRRNHEAGLISLPMGMENGAALEDDLDNLRHFYDRGIRYITLTHAKDNLISDSSYDSTRTWNGLSEYGRQVVAEMNRLGVMIDISHLTDSAAFQVLRLSQAPVIASHSSARHFTPGWERNMGDDLIDAVAEHEGVIMINFGSSFLRGEYRDAGRRIRDEIEAHIAEQGWDEDSPEARTYTHEQRRANPLGTLDDVADHIDYVAERVGAEHVGLGSDYDGVFALPAGLQDVAGYPALVAELLRRGYSEDDVRGILGENALRVWSAAEAVAQRGTP